MVLKWLKRNCTLSSRHFFKTVFRIHHNSIPHDATNVVFFSWIWSDNMLKKNICVDIFVCRSEVLFVRMWMPTWVPGTGFLNWSPNRCNVKIVLNKKVSTYVHYHCIDCRSLTFIQTFTGNEKSPINMIERH